MLIDNEKIRTTLSPIGNVPDQTIKHVVPGYINQKVYNISSVPLRFIEPISDAISPRIKENLC